MAAKRRVLIVGGYGVFGARAAQRLAREAGLEIIVAGRSRGKAQGAAAALQRSAVAIISAAAVDATAPDMAALAALAPAIVINASGPFQAQNFALARAAIEVGAHYIDLADAASFVTAFAGDAALDRAARTKGLLAVSGASTVPAISGAVLDHFAPAFARLDAMRHGISPGNSFDPGPATTASIMGGLGKPFRIKRDGAWVTVYGWQGLSRHRFPGIGTRWMGYCNIPDLTLFPARYPSLQTVDFRAGVDVSLFHLGLWAMTWPSRWGWLRTPERLVLSLVALKRRLSFLGGDVGGMFVELEGVDTAGERLRVGWHLVARQGHGPYVPVTPAVILAKKLLRAEVTERGAHACVGLVTLRDIQAELADLDISMGVA
jgi:hypothetical protein